MADSEKAAAAAAGDREVERQGVHERRQEGAQQVEDDGDVAGGNALGLALPPANTTIPARLVEEPETALAQDAAMPRTPQFAPLSDSNRKQFAKDSASASSHRLSSLTRAAGAGAAGSGRSNNRISRDGRPASSDSLPLQRVQSHGRQSILEMDLADAAMEPTSAADMAHPGMAERERRKMMRRSRRRRQTPSIASRQTRRTVRTRAGDALKAIKARARRGSSSSDSSASSSSSTGSSGSSSSTGINWRFWRASSTSEASDDSYIPPEPTFTLFTPRLANPLQSTHPSEHDLAQLGRKRSIPHPYTSKSAEQREHEDPQHAQAQGGPPVFDVFPSKALTPCLDRLRGFWQERDQQDGLGGDVGESHATLMPTLPRPTASRRPSARRIVDPVKTIGTPRNMRNAGPAWWLDVQCPSSADMRQLRRIIPLHPLTIEDILAQETREKIETHEALGYYFIAFRALDETYFRYTDVSSSASSSSTLSSENTSQNSQSSLDSLAKKEQRSSSGMTSTLKEKKSFDEESRNRKSMDTRLDLDAKKGKEDSDDDKLTLSGKPKKWKVEIVEGGKEGVEGVGVGAVNVYFVVFGDGVISFHFEDIDKHVGRVRDRIQQFGLARSISSHWIAYGLMDSIVDSFFPLIDFVESESDDIDAFLANPLSDPRYNHRSDVHVSESSNMHPEYLFRMKIPSFLQGRIPSYLARYMEQRTGMSHANSKGIEMTTLDAPGRALKPKTLAKRALKGVDDKLYDRSKMLTRIAVTRKIIIAMARILTPKMEVVRGFRKRVREESTTVRAGQRHDINIYLGDLQDHIITMQQTLDFFDTMLAHDHPAYLGILRLAYEAAKIGNDKALVRLYIVTLTFLPITIFTSAFSLNVAVPHNGSDADPTVEPDGSPAPYYAFGGVICGVGVVVTLVMLYVWWAFRYARKKYAARRMF